MKPTWKDFVIAASAYLLVYGSPVLTGVCVWLYTETWLLALSYGFLMGAVWWVNWPFRPYYWERSMRKIEEYYS